MCAFTLSHLEVPLLRGNWSSPGNQGLVGADIRPLAALITCVKRFIVFSNDINYISFLYTNYLNGSRFGDSTIISMFGLSGIIIPGFT